MRKSAAATCSCRSATANCCRRWAVHTSAGCCKYAVPATVFATPTVNGYRRFRPNSLAPDRADLGLRPSRRDDPRAGRPGDPATRLENRIGEPAANPYLFIASQIVAGLDGVDEQSSIRGRATTSPMRPTVRCCRRALREALDALEKEPLFRRELGDVFIDYFLKLKRNEAGRFHAIARRGRHAAGRRADRVGAE